MIGFLPGALVALIRARPAAPALREDDPEVAARRIIGSEQTRIAAVDALGETHNVPHFLLEHRNVAHFARKRFNRFTSKSVSYTHLRAHETVLDLVCRLLL